MSLNIIDVIIVLIILMGAIIGMKRGFIKQSVMTVGMILVVVLSFILKNPVSILMYKYLPFVSFSDILENLSVLNILLYEIIAFLVVFSILSAILIMFIKISAILEKLIKITVILAIPSKILGFILGAIEYYIIVFVILFVSALPTLKIEEFDFVNNSKLRPIILKNTPVISSITEKTINTFSDINNLIKNRNNMSDEEFNCTAIDKMVANGFLDEEALEYLYSKGKLNNNCK